MVLLNLVNSRVSMGSFFTTYHESSMNTFGPIQELMHLEELVEKYATEKSEAARKAFLAELERDKKNISKGVDPSKQVIDKPKDKKKNKDHRKAKLLVLMSSCSLVMKMQNMHICLIS
ncbi:hypothetical protein Sjap_019900 [Stephania japonica]|uniref:Uncharacterized protein n=1 Tax=Stephania japonica TaxID=461633 RepID=A0AAP0HZS9_9MAGN